MLSSLPLAVSYTDGANRLEKESARTRSWSHDTDRVAQRRLQLSRNLPVGLISSQLTWIVVGVGDNKHLKRLPVPLVGLVGNVKALFPHAAVRVVKLEDGVHIQHLE